MKHQLEKISKTNWDDICSNYLNRAIAPIAVRAVNQRTGATSLDYFNHKEDGLRVIAVGGNSLSRGLTLEGLGVSYFYRKSQMYDTLPADGALVWLSPKLRRPFQNLDGRRSD